MNTECESAARAMQDLGGPVLEYPVSHEKGVDFILQASGDQFMHVYFTSLSSEVSVFITDVNEKLLCEM